MSDYEEEMCPNCVTPWKCNGPHDIDFDDDGPLIPIRSVPAPPDDTDW